MQGQSQLESCVVACAMPDRMYYAMLPFCCNINGGFYMSAHVLLNLSNEFGKKVKCEAC